MGSLEKNMLFNAHGRFQVTQTGTVQLDLPTLFDGKFYPYYTPIGIPVGDSTVITIENLPTYHVQRGSWIGWTTRYWFPKRFKIQVYNVWSSTNPNYPAPNQWHTIVDEQNYSANQFAYFLPGSSASYVIPTKIRFIFYEGTGINGRLGLSELFYVNNEAVSAYDGLMVQHDKNQNVVIGNASHNPATTERGDMMIFSQGTDPKASLKIGYDASRSLEIYRNSNLSDINFVSSQANTGHMRFNTTNSYFTFNGGRFGIGTNTPSKTLEIKGGDEVGLRLFNQNANTWDINNSLFGKLDFVRGGQLKMRLDQFGKMSLGTEVNTEKLNVNGNARFDNGVTGLAIRSDNAKGGRTYLAIDGGVANGIAAGSDYLWLERCANGESSLNNTGSDFSLRTYGSYDVQVKPNNTVSTTFKSNGQVGIGTIDIPTGYKLAINGHAIAEKVVIRKNTNWPDYVFEDSYQLPNLSDIESYVKKNKHLPEIPSASEIEENGQDLGEMNKLLLKKVEELTLLLIDQDKRLEKIENKKKYEYVNFTPTIIYCDWSLRPRLYKQ
jgi:hypothetical protein